MSWLAITTAERHERQVWSTTFVALMIIMFAAPTCKAQAMQKGISVELAPTSNAVTVPDADSPDALIITVTDAGKLYFGVDPVTPSSLAEKLKGRLSHSAQNLYIKADARAPYAGVVKVLDAASAAGVTGVTLLTTQPNAMPARTVVSPEGIEIELARRPTAGSK